MVSPVHSTRFLVLLCMLTLTLSGCAGARLNKGADKPKAMTPAERIAELERQVQTKDQEIIKIQQELDRLHAREAAAAEAETEGASYGAVSNMKAAPSSGALRVPGVTVTELQRALEAAGHDPGTIDGRFGNKTKTAVRNFQREQGLKVDGVVGQKTWGALRRAAGSSS